MDETIYRSCRLCPRQCRIDRTVTPGYCGCTDAMQAARAALHHWEEPCISGLRGSGAVFFTGCALRCCYCQNHAVSQEGLGRTITVSRLADIFLRLEGQGAHNINLVTATQYLPTILRALDLVKPKLTIPVVYNCGGYETVETVRELDGYVDIWLPDMKYYSSELSARYSQAPDYFEKASAAIKQMIRQSGAPQYAFDAADQTRFTGRTKSNGEIMQTQCAILTKGTIIRHMVLPGAKEDSIRLLHWMNEALPKGGYLISILSQYTPFYHSFKYKEIHRRITSYEYDQVINEAISLGLTEGFMQEKSSAKEEYTPPFDMEGV